MFFLNCTLICRFNWTGLGGHVFVTQVWDGNQVEELVELIVFLNQMKICTVAVWRRSPLFPYQRAAQCSRAVIKTWWILESPCACTHKHTYAHTHFPAHTQAQRHVHTHIVSFSHTHTHTHTQHMDQGWEHQVVWKECRCLKLNFKQTLVSLHVPFADVWIRNPKPV